MDVKLVVTKGKHAGTAVPVPGPKFLIGRGEECQLRPNSDLISRQHCALLLEEGRLVVRDFNSRNGTFVNDQRVDGQHELKNGDRLRVGQLEFEVQFTVTVGGKKKPKVTSIREAAERVVQSAAGEALDVSEWLTQTETNAGAALSETTTFAMRSPEEEEGPKLPLKSGEKRPRTMFGEAAGGSKPTTADSRQAASDLLKRMFGQK